MFWDILHRRHFTASRRSVCSEGVVGWVSFQCQGVLLIWSRVGQGPTALVVGAGGGLDIYSLICHFSFLSPSLWETGRYRLKYCLKGPLSPKQPTTNCLFGGTTSLCNRIMPALMWLDLLWIIFGRCHGLASIQCWCYLLIKRVWDILGRHVWQSPQPPTMVAALRQVLQSERNAIPQVHINCFIQRNMCKTSCKWRSYLLLTCWVVFVQD